MPTVKKPTGAATIGRESRVILSLRFIPVPSREELEEHAITIQRAIDEEAAGIALGAAVACSDEPPRSIEAIFTVKARSVAETHYRVALVIGAIQAVLPSSTIRETHHTTTSLA